MTPNERLGDRRDGLRFEIIGELWATLVTTTSLPVVNVGTGGVLVESSGPLAVGSQQRARLSLGNVATELAATVRHCTPMQGRPDRYLVGLAFGDLPADARRQIEAIVGDASPTVPE